MDSSPPTRTPKRDSTQTVRTVLLATVLALVVSACANTEPPALTALTGGSEPTTQDSADDASADTADGSEASENDDSLAFRFEFDPSLEALRAMTKEDGTCAVFDAWFDAAFAESQPLAPGSGNDVAFIDDPTFAISTIDDGAFGAGWNELITEQHLAASEGREANISAEQITELDRLATEQCGYPVMTVLAVTDRQVCDTENCPAVTDPRPALRTS